MNEPRLNRLRVLCSTAAGHAVGSTQNQGHLSLTAEHVASLCHLVEHFVHAHADEVSKVHINNRSCACQSCADTAADDADLLQAFGLGRRAERADKVVEAIALILVIQQLGRAADDLEDDRHGSLFAIVARNGERNALAILIHAQDDELTGLRFLCDQRRFDVHQRDGGVENFFTHDFIHGVKSFLLFFI